MQSYLTLLRTSKIQRVRGPETGSGLAIQHLSVRGGPAVRFVVRLSPERKVQMAYGLSLGVEPELPKPMMTPHLLDKRYFSKPSAISHTLFSPAIRHQLSAPPSHEIRFTLHERRSFFLAISSYLRILPSTSYQPLALVTERVPEPYRGKELNWLL